MDIRSDRRHRFDLAPEELWPHLIRVEDYRTWWPWLRACDARAFAPGERWACTVQPPLPYVLRFTLALDEVVPASHVTASIDGDIQGVARLELAAIASGTELRLTSTLGPAHPLLRLVARTARPVVRLGHDWVLDSGLRQFRDRALP